MSCTDSVPTLTPDNGVQMPALGFGVFQTPPDQTAEAEHGIVSQAWSPIGGITSYRATGATSTYTAPTLAAIAQGHGKSPAQVMLR